MLEQVFANILSDNLKHLYAWDYDRLSRNDKVWDTLKYGIVDKNVILYSRDSIVDLNNPTDRMLFDVRKAVTVYDNSLRAIRSKRGKIDKAKLGYYMNSTLLICFVLLCVPLYKLLVHPYHLFFLLCSV